MVLNVGAEGFSFVLAYIEPENMLLLFFLWFLPHLALSPVWKFLAISDN